MAAVLVLAAGVFEQPAELWPADMTPREAFPSNEQLLQEDLSMSQRSTAAQAAAAPDFLQFNDLGCETVGGKVSPEHLTCWTWARRRFLFKV